MTSEYMHNAWNADPQKTIVNNTKMEWKWIYCAYVFGSGNDSMQWLFHQQKDPVQFLEKCFLFCNFRADGNILLI